MYESELEGLEVLPFGLRLQMLIIALSQHSLQQTYLKSV